MLPIDGWSCGLGSSATVAVPDVYAEPYTHAHLKPATEINHWPVVVTVVAPAPPLAG